MKKILGLVASQRRLANGEILVKEAAFAAGMDYRLELIRMPELQLKPCRGCYTCLTPGKLCPSEDDLYFLAEKMKEADGIILSVPCYSLGPAAIVKMLGDRSIALGQMLEDFWGKPCVVIGTAGLEGWEGYTLSAATMVVRLLGFAIKDSEMFIGALPGEVLERKGALERVRQLGQALFGEARRPGEGFCPSCRSDIWKFPHPEVAVCPFCGQTARLAAGNSGLTWEYGTAGQRFDKQKLEEHFNGWLMVKAQEFITRRREIAVIRSRYKKEGIWLKPVRHSIRKPGAN